MTISQSRTPYFPLGTVGILFRTFYAVFMRILYVAQSRFPTEKAHGYQIALVCNALSELGHDVTLVVPRMGVADPQSAFAQYGIPSSFSIVQLDSFNALSSRWVPGFLAFAVGMFSYRKKLRIFLQKQSFDLLYTRSSAVVPALRTAEKPIILELHALPHIGKSFLLSLCKQVRLVVCLTTAMRLQLVQWGADTSNIIVEGDAVDLSGFADLPLSADAKKKWSLPTDKKVIGYVGSLVTRVSLEKGVRELIAALSLLKNRDAFGWIVGGNEDEQRPLKALAKSLGLTQEHIRFDQRIAPADVPTALRACDVCVYPVPASNHPYFHRDTSPLKLFEYLASGVSIVTADTLPVRDIVDERSVTFCAPGDSDSLAVAIDIVLGDPQTAHTKAQYGLQIVQEHSWEKRMQRILSSL